MIGTAFVVGFFTALGWWSAGHVTQSIDKQLSPPAIEQQEEKENTNDR